VSKNGVMMGKTKSSPLVSVVMPVYNAGNFLVEAVESILNQTFSNFEFIIVDDASTDNSWEILKRFSKKDKRIKLFKNKKNLGVSATANLAISKADGQYLVRMDADDISFPHRLHEQVNFLKNNPNIVAVGSQCVVIDENDQVIGRKTFPVSFKDLKKMAFWAIPIQQPALAINRSLLPKNFNWYSSSSASAEEVDLIFRLMKYGQIANLADFLLFYRYRADSLSHIRPKETFWLTFKSRANAIKLGYCPSPKAIFLNLVQVFLVVLLPNRLITELWHYWRGIDNRNQQAAVSEKIFVS